MTAFRHSRPERRLLSFAIRRYLAKHGGSFAVMAKHLEAYVTASASADRTGQETQKACGGAIEEMTHGQGLGMSNARTKLRQTMNYLDEDAPKPFIALTAAFLADQGLYPPDTPFERACGLIPWTFDGASERAAQSLARLPGRFACYQVSNTQPEQVRVSLLSIQRPTAWFYAEMRDQQSMEREADWRGVFWSGGPDALYGLIRDEQWSRPRFLLLNHLDAAEKGGPFTQMRGYVLGGARIHSRHFSRVFVQRLTTEDRFGQAGGFTPGLRAWADIPARAAAYLNQGIEQGH